MAELISQLHNLSIKLNLFPKVIKLPKQNLVLKNVWRVTLQVIIVFLFFILYKKVIEKIIANEPTKESSLTSAAFSSDFNSFLFFFVNKTAAGFYKGLSPAKKLRNFT